MKKSEEYLLERIYTNGEAISRFMMIVAEALPHTRQAVRDLHNEWVSILNEMAEEYKEAADEVDHNNEHKDT